MLNDICRCHDAQCPLAQSCDRFLQRNTGSDRTPQAASLRDGKNCSQYLPTMKTETETTFIDDCTKGKVSLADMESYVDLARRRS